MPAYNDALRKIGATQVSDLTDLCATLENLRKPKNKSKQWKRSSDRSTPESHRER